jgi:acylphosphatase
MSERRAYRLSGRVQGVGFRWWAKETAGKLGLRGLVRNEPDGTVWLDTEGDAPALDQFEQLLETGPPGAVVQEVRPVRPGTGGLPSRFEIAR